MPALRKTHSELRSSKNIKSNQKLEKSKLRKTNTNKKMSSMDTSDILKLIKAK